MAADRQPISIPAWIVEYPDGRKLIVDLESVLGTEWVYNGVVDLYGAMITIALWPADAAGNPAELPPDPDPPPPPPPSPRSREW
jgi:hypothetical protein